MNPIILSIEGNIGTGKSTLIHKLRNHYHDDTCVVFLQEPVSEWLNLVDEDQKNILDTFYGDMKRWSFTFQLNAFITRMRSIQKLVDEHISSHKQLVLIMERSIYTDKNIFAQTLYHDGFMTGIEWQLYSQWFEWLNTTFSSYIPTHYLYLRCDPNISFERMQKRGREEEKGITLEYIKQIHEAHDRWLIQNGQSEVNCGCMQYEISDSDAGYEELFDMIVGYVEIIRK